jgi:succinate dehydrogenase/fumarate reductase cytochrome b subunit
MPDQSAHPPHHTFDPEEYERRTRDRANTFDVPNRAPYSPRDIKAAHEATALNVSPAAGKKRVTIAIVIAYNWPVDYIQSCLDAMCRVYGLASRPLEMINLNLVGEKYATSEIETAALAPVNAMIASLKTYIGRNNSSTSATPSAELNKTDALNEYYASTPTPTSSERFTARSQLNWLEELILDLWAFSMNPNAHIRIIGAYTNSISVMLNAVKYASTDSNFAANPYGTTDLVTMSWGGNALYDTTPANNSAIFRNPKICYFASTGDVSFSTYPATSPDVLAVGGVSLYYNAAATSASEKGPYNSVWNTNGRIASGTGFARNHAKPSYQTNLPAFSAAPFNANKRCAPDLASLADPATGVLIFLTDGTTTADAKLRKTQLGGTSLASPIICGLFSHLIQMRINADKAALTTIMNHGTSVHLQTLLYGEQGALFYDVVDGSVSVPNDSTSYHINAGLTFVASPGHDIPSGMGFPKMNSAMIERVTSIVQSSTPDPPDPPPSEVTSPDPTGCTIPWTNVCGCESCYVPLGVADSAIFNVADSDIPEGFANWSQLIGKTVDIFLMFQRVTGILHAIAKNRIFVTVQSVTEPGLIFDKIFVVTTVPSSPVPVTVNELAAGNATTITVSNPALYAVGKSITVAVSVTRRITGVIHAIVGNQLLVTVTAVTTGTYSQSDINVPTIIIIPPSTPTQTVVNELAAGNTTTITVSNPALYAVGKSITVAVSVTRRITGAIHAIVANKLLVTVTAVTAGAYSQSDINVPTILV